MSNGGIRAPDRPAVSQVPGLRTIGSSTLSMLVFCLVTVALTTHFALYRGTFTRPITHKREGFFVPAVFLSAVALITSTQWYAVPNSGDGAASPRFDWAIRVAFRASLVAATGVTVGQYSYVSSAHRFGLHTTMPTPIPPILPVMLSRAIA